MTRARLTAAEVARAWGVDLKTIHNWVDKGKVHATRTEGRHLRFSRLDVVEQLRAHAHPVPAALLATRARVCFVGEPVVGAAARALARRFELVSQPTVVDALVALHAIDPEVLVLDDERWIFEARVIERLSETPATRHVRIVLVSTDAARRSAALRAGARAAVIADDATALRDALDRIAAGDVSALRGTP